MDRKKALSITDKIEPRKMSSEESRAWGAFCGVVLGIIQSFETGRINAPVKMGRRKRHVQ